MSLGRSKKTSATLAQEGRTEVIKPTLQNKLAKLHESAKALHEETDALNILYKQIEEGLQGVGVTFWWGTEHFDLKAGNDEECEAYTIIGYAKLSDQWCLATKYIQRPSETEEIDSFQPIQLIRASRAVRVEFAPRIEDFIDALIAEVARTLNDVENAKCRVAKHLGGGK